MKRKLKEHLLSPKIERKTVGDYKVETVVVGWDFTRGVKVGE
jgi:hypothetical protein